MLRALESLSSTESLDRVPGSYLYSGPTLTFEALRGVDQQMKSLSLFFSLSYCSTFQANKYQWFTKSQLKVDKLFAKSVQ